MSPSWKLHKMVGKIVCNFYDHEIDRLIDSTGSHDAGRYNKDINLITFGTNGDGREYAIIFAITFSIDLLI